METAAKSQPEPNNSNDLSRTSLKKALTFAIQLLMLGSMVFGACRYLITTHDMALQALEASRLSLAQKADRDDIDELRNDVKELRKELNDYILRQRRK